MKTLTPTHALTEPTQELQIEALLQGTGFRALENTGWIRVAGDERVRWLNGMVTNSIQSLQLGEGCYNFLLNAQGRIQGDAYIFAEPDALLLETASPSVASLIALLDRFIIMDDVELADASHASTGLLVAGPKAQATLAAIGLEAEDLAELSFTDLRPDSASVRLLRAYSPLVPRFELWSDAATIESLRHVLTAQDAVPCGSQSVEWLRILSATPAYGVDIRDRDLPQETAQRRALNFAKGCYLGQEIVERIRSRGQVHRTFSAFRLQGSLPAPGTSIEADGKTAGVLTSTATIPSLQGKAPLHLALGYVRREALDRHAPLLYPGGSAHPVPASAHASTFPL